jgi:hypothetical protein
MPLPKLSANQSTLLAADNITDEMQKKRYWVKQKETGRVVVALDPAGSFLYTDVHPLIAPGTATSHLSFLL